jgi:hypothetical protein
VLAKAFAQIRAQIPSLFDPAHAILVNVRAALILYPR